MSIWGVVAVVALLALFVGAAFLVRRFAGGSIARGSGQEIEVCGYRRLDPETHVFILLVDGRRLLVGGGKGRVNLIAELSDSR